MLGGVARMGRAEDGTKVNEFKRSIGEANVHVPHLRALLLLLTGIKGISNITGMIVCEFNVITIILLLMLVFW